MDVTVIPVDSLAPPVRGIIPLLIVAGACRIPGPGPGPDPDLPLPGVTDRHITCEPARAQGPYHRLTDTRIVSFEEAMTTAATATATGIVDVLPHVHPPAKIIAMGREARVHRMIVRAGETVAHALLPAGSA